MYDLKMWEKTRVMVEHIFTELSMDEEVLVMGYFTLVRN